MISIRAHSGTDVIDFDDYEELEHLDYIINMVREKFNIQICRKFDGPGATIWDLSIDNFDFSLANGTYGNYLRPINEKSREYLHQIYPLIRVLFY